MSQFEADMLMMIGETHGEWPCPVTTYVLVTYSFRDEESRTRVQHDIAASLPFLTEINLSIYIYILIDNNKYTYPKSAINHSIESLKQLSPKSYKIISWMACESL